MSVATNTKSLPLMEAFYSLQGEGHHAGKAAYFIRLGGCDVGCHWCDVKESWNASDHPLLSVEHIVAETQKNHTTLVVVTGGEPSDARSQPIVHRDLNRQRMQHTPGNLRAYPISGSWDWICFSPKKFKSAPSGIYQKAHELKIVIFHPSDFRWAEQHARLVISNASCICSPNGVRQTMNYTFDS